eukprot:4292441-Amphidinium_carterae.1
MEVGSAEYFDRVIYFPLLGAAFCAPFPAVDKTIQLCLVSICLHLVQFQHCPPEFGLNVASAAHGVGCVNSVENPG